MTDQKKQYVLSMTIIGALFFVFGFVTWVNGTLIPYLKIACELETELQSYLVATAFFIAYTVMALPSSVVLRATGYKKGMALGLLVMAVGALIFVPAANARSYNMFLFGLFIIGTGLALLQTASNPYVSIIGPIESAATRISIMGICNKFAGILAGLIFGYIALKDADALEASLATMDAAARAATLDELAGRVVVPYIIIAGVLVLLAVAVVFSSLPDINDEGDDSGAVRAESKKSIFDFPHLFLGVLALFLYVGVEVMAGDTIISYGKSLGIELSIARYFTQATLAFMLIGYIVGIFTIPKYISQQAALSVCAVLGVVFTILALLCLRCIYRAAGIGQLTDLACDLSVGYQRTGTIYEDRIGAADYGNCRRRVAALGLWVAPRSARMEFTTRLCHDGAVLPVHPVLRNKRIPGREGSCRKG